MPNGLGTEVHWFCPSLDTAGKDTTTLTDLAGTNDATLTNMSASTDWFDAGGLVSIDCDGTDDTCKCGSSDAIGTSDLTLTMWVYDRENANNDWCATRNTGAYGSQAGWSVGHGGDATAGKIYFHVDDGSSNYLAETWTVGDQDKWVHYAFVWDNSAGTLKLYKNGVDQGAGTVAASGGTPAGKSMTGTVVTISGRPNASSRSLDGQFDDLRIFHEVLSAGDITNLASERGYPDVFGAGGGSALPRKRLQSIF